MSECYVMWSDVMWCVYGAIYALNTFHRLPSAVAGTSNASEIGDANVCCLLHVFVSFGYAMHCQCNAIATYIYLRFYLSTASLNDLMYKFLVTTLFFNSLEIWNRIFILVLCYCSSAPVPLIELAMWMFFGLNHRTSFWQFSAENISLRTRFSAIRYDNRELMGFIEIKSSLDE